MREYWEERHGHEPSLSTVGWMGLGPSFNDWMYRVRRLIFLRTAKPLVHDSMSVLDVGAGSGFYIDLWSKLGAEQIAGADLTDTSVAYLRKRYPSCTFQRCDVSDAIVPFPNNSYDVISAMDVLFHITDDERYARSFVNFYRLLRPGGALLFTDNFLHGQTLRAERQVSRSLKEIETVVRAAGFSVIDRRPLFFFMNTPVDSSNYLLRAQWNTVQKIITRNETFAHIAGAMLYPLELLATHVFQEGPSTELMLCRRDG